MQINEISHRDQQSDRTPYKGKIPVAGTPCFKRNSNDFVRSQAKVIQKLSTQGSKESIRSRKIIENELYIEAAFKEIPMKKLPA